MSESTAMVRRAEAATGHLGERSSLLPSTDTLQTMLTMSKALFESGLLPNHIKTPQAAFAVIQKGLELGIPPMYSMSNIAVIQGKPTANAELMLALIYRDHGDSAIMFKDTTAEKCVIAYKRRAWSDHKHHSFTIQDAKTAKLLSNQTWEKYPAAMLRARCISAVARLAFPDSIGGMYTPEELGATVNVTDDGEVFVMPEETQPQAAKPEPQQQAAQDYSTLIAVEVLTLDRSALVKHIRKLIAAMINRQAFADFADALSDLRDFAMEAEWQVGVINKLEDIQSEDYLRDYAAGLAKRLQQAQ